ncbi:MAG: WYL domain-containing protein, partial [Marmoricola sp.]
VDEPRQEHDLTPRDLSDGLFEPGPEDIEAVLHLERYARWVADYYPVESVEELGGGRLEARLRVGDPRWLVRLALRVAPGLTVVEPRELSAEVARTAGATLALYDTARG